jgi:inosine/xanthosine triphosphatase
MKKVIIGSKNPVKIKCVEIAFGKLFAHESFEFTGTNSASEVSDQPMSNQETYQGACNRAQNAKVQLPDAHYWVGIEGGIDYFQGRMEAFAWVIILSKNQLGQARTASFVLPNKVQALVEQGIELGVADDMVFDRNNSKQQGGAVGILTNDVITRTTYYEQAVTLAAIPMVKSALY